MQIFRSPRATRFRIAAGTAIFATSVVASLPWEAWAADAARPVVRQAAPVTFLGQPLAMPRDAAAEAHRLAQAFLDAPMTLVTGSTRITRPRRELGVSIDEARLARWLAQAFDHDSEMHAARAAMGLRGTIGLVPPWTLDASVITPRLVDLADRTNRAPVDARMDVARGQLVADRPGLRLDVDGTLDALRAALDSGELEVHAVVREMPARRTLAMLEGASMAAVLGSFETRYNPSLAVADRTHNLRIAAERIDGYVLLPGEEFDFNAIVGERSEANGFRAAPVIEAGEIDLGVGGGACQISGSLHAAVFFAGLPIEGRLPHSRPSSYIKLGLDAMVSWPDKNFRFRNDLPHPVVLRLSVGDGVVRAELRGPSRNRMVSFVRRIDQVTPYEERFDDDPTLPSGVRVLAQRGMPGFRLTRFRVVRDLQTQQARRERTRDVYPPTTQIWRVGTGGPAPADYVPPPGDNHPEYRADQLLELVQGPGLEGMQEFATPGWTGVPGWTRTAGMPYAE